MRPAKLLDKLSRGALRNVRFADAQRLVEACGFELVRVSGSHHVYSHPGAPELLNLQQVRGEAKPYQLRQFVQLLERYDLGPEER